MVKLNVQTDRSPLLSSADEYDIPVTKKYGDTGIVYPVAPNPNSVDVITVIDTSNRGRFGFSKGLKVVMIAVINIVTNVLMNVSLPIFAGTMDVVGGDTFVVLVVSALSFPILFFVMVLVVKFATNPTLAVFKTGASVKILFIMGLLTTLNGIFVVFASPPTRTPPYLQGILATTTIPYTVICRFLILRKGISIRRLACVVTVLIGLFITIEPQIWGLPGSGTTDTSGSSSVLWPMLFALGFLPAAISGVICEKELKSVEADSLTFLMYTQVFQMVTLLPLFWVDFIPHFGMADSLHDFWSKLSTGLGCCFSSHAACNGLAFKVWLFFAGYCLGNLFQFLLIQYAEGAVYAVVVQSMVTPLATLFWTLFAFVPKDNHFFWNPQFNMTTAFTLGGLLIIVPSIIMYNYFSKKDAKEKQLREGFIRDIIGKEM